MHCEPLAKHRPQMGCSLLHLTLDAAHASHEARSLGRRSLSDFGAEVGDLTVGDEVGGEEVGACHWLVCDVNEDMVATRTTVIIARVEWSAEQMS